LIGRGRRHAGGRGAVVTIALLIIALLIAVVLPDCGGHSAPVGNRVHGRTLTVYVSVPLHGASAVSGSAVLNGARLALADSSGRVGRYRIGLKGLDGSPPQRA